MLFEGFRGLRSTVVVGFSGRPLGSYFSVLWAALGELPVPLFGPRIEREKSNPRLFKLKCVSEAQLPPKGYPNVPKLSLIHI